MLISHRKKFIFTKTVKTGGTSVEVYFEKYCMPEGEWSAPLRDDQYVQDTGIIGYRGNKTGADMPRWYNHMPAKDIRDNIGDEIWNTYFKFTIVRNPFDKLVSGFYFFNREAIKGLSETGVISAFREWVKTREVIKDQQNYMIDGQVCLDYFIRYEDMLAGIAHVCKTIDAAFEPEALGKYKSGIRNQAIPLDRYFDDETRAVVAERHGLELDYFGYQAP